MPYYYYWDPTYFLVLIGMIVCLAASASVNSAMKKYGKVRNSTGMTGGEAARRILNSEGLYDVQVAFLQQLPQSVRDGGQRGGP